jgi:hypothetical protein
VMFPKLSMGQSQWEERSSPVNEKSQCCAPLRGYVTWVDEFAALIETETPPSGLERINFSPIFSLTACHSSIRISFNFGIESGARVVTFTIPHKFQWLTSPGNSAANREWGCIRSECKW